MDSHQSDLDHKARLDNTSDVLPPTTFTENVEVKPGFSSSFLGLATMMIYERVTFKKMLSLGIRLLIIPGFLFLILSSPITSQFENTGMERVLLNKYNPSEPDEDGDQMSFEAFMAPENAGPTPEEKLIEKKLAANEEFDGLDGQAQGEVVVTFYLTCTTYLLVGVPLICVVFAGGLSRDEIRNDTLPFFLCRPITRTRYITIRLISQIIWTQVVLGIQTALITGVAIYKGVPWMAQATPYIFLAQILSIPFWSALGIFLGLINKNYLIFAIIYGAIVEFAIASLPTNIKVIAMTTHMKSILGNAEITLPIAHSWATLEPLWTTFLPLAIGFSIFLGLTALAFHFKELLPSKEVEN